MFGSLFPSGTPNISRVNISKVFTPLEPPSQLICVCPHPSLSLSLSAIIIICLVRHLPGELGGSLSALLSESELNTQQTNCSLSGPACTAAGHRILVVSDLNISCCNPTLPYNELTGLIRLQFPTQSLSLSLSLS